MEKPPVNEPFNRPDGSISEPWLAWINKLWMVAGSLDNSGTTADRPTKGLYVGRPYFDTTLGQPIWLRSVRPTVWIKAAASNSANSIAGLAIAGTAITGFDIAA